MALITTSNISGATRSFVGPSQGGAVGDVWKVDLRGQFPDNVATSTTLLFRQNDSYPDEVNVAQQLIDDFTAFPAGPIQALLQITSDEFSYECAIVTNLSVANSLAETISLNGGTGDQVGEFIQSTVVVPVLYMDDTGFNRARKTMYIPGVAANQVTNSKLTEAAEQNVFGYITRLYNFGGPGAVNWSWMYGEVDGEFQRANNAHPDIFVGRLYSRDPSLC